MGALRDAVARHTDLRSRLVAVFEAQATVFAQPGFRGCAFVAACAEAPPGGLIQSAAVSYRQDIRELLVELCEAAESLLDAQLPAAASLTTHPAKDGCQW